MTGMTKATMRALGFMKRIDLLEADGHNRNEHHLGDAVSNADLESCLAAIPAGDEDLPLVVGVDEAHQIAQYDAVLVAQAGARQQHRGQSGVADVDGQAGRYQVGLARLERQRLVEAGAQVQAG